MKYKCRCNKRSCQARVTRNKHPDEYKVKRYRKCPRYPACDGDLYVDWFRMDKNNQEKDSGKICNCDGLPFKHRLGQKGCNHRDDVILEKSLQPLPKHHPFPQPYFEEF